MVAARKKAIDYYTLIKNSYPTYSQMDEVLYYLAYEYEQGQDLDNARKVYYELIQKAPQSKYIPNAYLAFGELFFNEAQGDPRSGTWPRARTKRSSSIRRRTTRSSATRTTSSPTFYWNKGEFPRALDEFKKTIDYGDSYAAIPNAAQLAKAARRDLIPVYALSGRPEAAYNFFQNLSGDEAGETAEDVQDDGRSRSRTTWTPVTIPRPSRSTTTYGARPGREVLPLPGARDASDAGDEVRQQGL